MLYFKFLVGSVLLILLQAVSCQRDIEMAKADNRFTLFDAVDKEELDKLKKYLVNGGDPTQKDRHGNTPLHRISYCSINSLLDETLCLLLLQPRPTIKVDIHAKNNAGKTPLDAAVYGNNYTYIQFFVNHQIPINNAVVTEALELAVTRKHVESIKPLVGLLGFLNKQKGEELKSKIFRLASEDLFLDVAAKVPGSIEDLSALCTVYEAGRENVERVKRWYLYMEIFAIIKKKEVSA